MSTETPAGSQNIREVASTSPDVNDSIQKVIIELKSRAQRTEAQAQTYLYLIIGVIISGLALFIYANQIVSNTGLEKVLKEVERVYQEQYKNDSQKLDSVLTLINQTALNVRSQAQSIRDSSVQKNFVDKKGFLLQVGAQVSKLDQKLDSSRSVFKEDMARVDSLSNTYFLDVKDKVLGYLNTADFETTNLIHTLATRLGAVLILLFLVQILIRVFRYNIRLSNFYNARANVLELYLIDKEKHALELVTAMLSPDSMDMGISKSPSDQFLEYLKILRTK